MRATEMLDYINAKKPSENKDLRTHFDPKNISDVDRKAIRKLRKERKSSEESS